MHIVVITKSTPDDNARIRVNDAGTVTWGEGLVINPWDEYAVTEAVNLRDAHGGKVTVLTLGGEEQNEALKQGLAIGCDEAIRIWDEALADHDSLQYAKAMAAAINKLEDVDMILLGKEFLDTYHDLHIYQLGRKLGWNVVASLTKILETDFDAKTIKIERMVEQGVQTVSAKLPAVIGLFDDINEPKYPSFIGIRKASKAVIPVWGAAELGIDLGQPATKVIEYSNLPERAGAVEWIEGDSPAEKATNLANRLIEEKLL